MTFVELLREVLALEEEDDTLCGCAASCAGRWPTLR